MSHFPPLRPWQADEVRESALTPKRAIFADKRTGKTRAAIESLARAVKPFGIERGIIVSPTAFAAEWADQLEEFGFPVVRGYAMSITEMLKSLPRHGILVLNQDKIGGPSTRLCTSCKHPKKQHKNGAKCECGQCDRYRLTSVKITDVLLRWGPHAYIRDESHRDKDPQSEMGKASRRIARGSKWVRLLTGTPSPNHYGDLWGQMVSVAPSDFGTWSEFRQRYLICDSMFPSRVLGHINVDELQGKLLRHAAFVRRDDVFGPDSWNVTVRNVEMPSRALQMYEKLAKEWILGGEPEALEIDVRADHILKRLIRLQQLTSGFLPDELGQIHEIHDCKVAYVMADLDEIFASGEKAVIFHKFRWEAQTYRDRIAREFPKVRAFSINGDTSASARIAVERAFNAHEGPAIIVAQTQSANLGLSFAEAAHALFVSQLFSHTDEEQARDRIFKPGHARSVAYYRCPDTVDDFIADVIDSKQPIHHAVMHADRETMAFGRIQRRKRRVA